MEKVLKAIVGGQNILEGVPLLQDKDIADLVIYGLSTPRHAQVCRYYSRE